ncbi:MAG: hypothetical protein HOC71_04995 [Candidatus Latescibacteria bacterium]|jgi:hypothetical protein|nr:hypothetical protein [Candidatus Latescibacterota bacterium]
MQRKHEGKNKKIRKCFLCGSTNGLTRDHIPPKNLFKPPLPTDLITVPSCKKCNESYQLDEEYFRTFVATQGYNNKIGKWVWNNKVINSTLKRSPALNTELLKNIINIDTYSLGGIYLGKQNSIVYDKKRINSVVEKICRGLFSHHHPEINITGMKCKINMVNVNNETIKNLSSLKIRSIGKDTFIYWYGFSNKNLYDSFWAFLFYTRTMFSISTKPI